MADNIKNRLIKNRNIAKLELMKAEMEVNPITNDIDTKFDSGNLIAFGMGSNVDDRQESNRIQFIENMMLTAIRQPIIKANIMQTFSITEAKANDYIRKAKAAMDDGWRDYFPDEVNWHVNMRKKIISKTIKDKGGTDYKIALQALDSLAKIQGVYDNKPAISTFDTEFDSADNGANEQEILIESIQSGDLEAFVKAQENYRKNDIRVLEAMKKENNDIDADNDDMNDFEEDL
jgi:hypothetical protein